MKIASYLLVLTFALYPDLGGSSSWERGAGSHDITLPRRTHWITVRTHGKEVEVKKDFITRDNIGIKLPGKEGAAIRLHEGFLFRVNVKAQNLRFIVQIDPLTEEWKAVALLTFQFRNLPLLPRRL